MSSDPKSAESKKRTAKASKAPYRPKSRIGKKAVVGYFSPKLAQQLSILAATEGTTIQSLLGEGIDLLLEKRKLTPLNER